MRRDPVLARIIRAHPGIALATRGDAFQTLARSIVGQQISVKAAESVWRRFIETLGTVEPHNVLRAGVQRLASSGLSRRKAEYMLDLARHFRAGTLDVKAWASMEDETVIDQLTEVRGIGRWTAEMFLIFNLCRPDVFPLDDLGIKRAASLHYYSGRPVSVDALRELGKKWVPWRSVATWYLWRSLDPIPVEY